MQGRPNSTLFGVFVMFPGGPSFTVPFPITGTEEVILSWLNQLRTNSSDWNRLLYYLLDNVLGVSIMFLMSAAMIVTLNLVFSKGSGNIITEASEIPITSSTTDRAISGNMGCQWTWKIWTLPLFGEETAERTSSKATSIGATTDARLITVTPKAPVFGKDYLPILMEPWSGGMERATSSLEVHTTDLMIGSFKSRLIIPRV